MTRFLIRYGAPQFLTAMTGCTILILSLSFISCSDKNVDQDKFIDAYIDLHIAEDTLNQVKGDVQKIKEKILAKHGMTWKDYNETFENYNKNPEMWDEFYAKVIARVDTLKKMKQK